MDILNEDYIGLRFIMKKGYPDCYDPVDKYNTYTTQNIDGVDKYVVLGHESGYSYEIEKDLVECVEEYNICNACGGEIEFRNDIYWCEDAHCINFREEDDAY